MRSRVCRTALSQSALETSDPGASNGGSKLQIRHFGADFEVAGWARNWNLSTDEISFLGFEFLAHPATSKGTMSAPECRISMFDPPFDAPGSEVSSAV